MSSQPQPLALYVHIPFCTAKCTYCDFNSYAGQESLMAPYALAVAAEASLWAARVADRPVETVFFGGGTPSVMPLTEMTTIVKALKESFRIAPGAEISLEANPGTVSAEHLRGLRALGFDRISFGVQSFHDSELLQLQRVHGGDDVERAYRWAREAGFGNINLDLIFGLAGQSLEDWRENVERALGMGPEHLSLYALTLEEGTPLTRDVERGRTEGPDSDLQADMYEWSRDRLAAAGYEQYEISNWSLPGRECRHNLVYWRNGEWLGLGAGAHSHLDGERFANASTPSRYISLVTEAASSGQSAGAVMRQVTYREPVDQTREMSETVILALRLREGLDLRAFRERFGVGFGEVFAEAMGETMEMHLTEVVGGRIRLRDEAILLGNEAFIRFLPEQAEQARSDEQEDAAHPGRGAYRAGD